MPPGPDQSSHNVKAGVFVLVSLALAVGIVVTLAGGPRVFERTSRYIVRFSLEEGAAGLVQGSEVHVGGRRVGDVTSVSLAYPEDGPPVGVDVSIAIDARIPMREGVIAYLERPLLGSGAVINFPTVGGGEGDLLDESDRIPGKIAPPEVLRAAGYGAAQAEQLKNMFARAEDISDRAASLMDDLENRIVPNLAQASEDIGAVTEDVRARSDVWLGRADTFTADMTEFSSSAKDSLEDARTFIASVNELVEEHRGTFDQTLQRIESASTKADALLDRLNEQSVDLLNAMLEDGRSAVAQAEETLLELDALLAEERPQIEKTIANLRLASDQMRLTMGEVRRAPWRLLYRPDTKELEYELLYDAARSYASAVSDLRAAAESLESTVGADRVVSSFNGRPVEEVLTDVQDAFEQYKTAESRFLDMLATEAP